MEVHRAMGFRYNIIEDNMAFHVQMVALPRPLGEGGGMGGWGKVIVQAEDDVIGAFAELEGVISIKAVPAGEVDDSGADHTAA